MSNVEPLVRPVAAAETIPRTTVVARPYFDTTFRAEIRWGQQGQYTARQDQGGEAMGVSIAEQEPAEETPPNDGSSSSSLPDSQTPGMTTYSFSQRGESYGPYAVTETVDAFCPRDSRKRISILSMVGGSFTGPARLRSGTSKEDDGAQIYDFTWMGGLNNMFLRVVDANWEEPVRFLGRALFCNGYEITFKADDSKACNLKSKELQKGQNPNPYYWQQNSYHEVEANQGYVLRGQRIKVTLTRTAEAVVEEHYSDGEWRAKGFPQDQLPTGSKYLGDSTTTTSRAQIGCQWSFPQLGLSWLQAFPPYEYVSSFSGFSVTKDNRSVQEATREAAFGIGPAPTESGYIVEAVSFSTSASEHLPKPESAAGYYPGAGYGTYQWVVMSDEVVNTSTRSSSEPNAGEKPKKTGIVRMGRGEIRCTLYEDGELIADDINVSVNDNPDKLLFARNLGVVVNLGIAEETVIPPQKPYQKKVTADITV